jgi:tRNA dimethylallyltransferase
MDHGRFRRGLVVMIGPTAVGKTKLSLELAAGLEAEIISLDSRLLYRGMDIGTAKPSREELRRVPHHLIDVANPDEDWSLATYRQAAEKAIHVSWRRQRLPMLVGGTGQYYRALIEGWDPPRVARSDAFRARMAEYAREHGHLALHRGLERIDPRSAQRIDARNIRRVTRALEIFHLTGKPASEQRVKHPPAYPILILGVTLPREELYQRIDARIDQMLRAGWVDEVRSLLAEGYSPRVPSFSAIGYRELARFIEGEISLEKAKVLIRRHSRQFVRRQANWFKPTDKAIIWFENRKGIAEAMHEQIIRWLETSTSSL